MIHLSTDELETAEKLDPRLSAIFEAADDVLNGAFGCTQQALVATTQTTTDGAKAVLLTIAYDCAKRFRAMLALAELRSAENADILVRSLFETMLAERFILRPWPRGGKYKLPPQPKNYTGRHFRAMLYVAAPAIKTQKLASQAMDRKGLKRMIPQSVVKSIDTAADHAEATIGRPWADRIRQSKSFCGLKVAELSAHVGMTREHLSLYGLQSNVAHGGDASRHSVISETTFGLNTEPDFEFAIHVLAIGAGYLATAISDICKALGIDAESRLRPRYQRFKESISVFAGR